MGIKPKLKFKKFHYKMQDASAASCILTYFAAQKSQVVREMRICSTVIV